MTQTGILKCYRIPNNNWAKTTFTIKGLRDDAGNDSITLLVFNRYHTLVARLHVNTNGTISPAINALTGTAPSYTTSGKTLTFTNFQTWSAQYVMMISPYWPYAYLEITH